MLRVVRFRLAVLRNPPVTPAAQQQAVEGAEVGCHREKRGDFMAIIWGRFHGFMVIVHEIGDLVVIK